MAHMLLICLHHCLLLS